jgi:excisionase family DNA binding protein
MLKVSIQTIDREIKKGKLKRLKIGARVLIAEDDLKEYLSNAKKEEPNDN